MEEQINKIRPLHTVNCCSVLKRKEIPSQVATGMNLEDIMLSEIRQSCKDELDKGQKWYGPKRSRRY